MRLSSTIVALGLALLMIMPASATDLIPFRGATQLALGGEHACALVADGVKCWGSNNSGQLGNGGNQTSVTPVDVAGMSVEIAAVSVGRRHSCALTAAGAVHCWGENSEGQVGDGTTLGPHYVPVPVVGLQSGVSAISAGAFHTCALLGSGGVKCWGANRDVETGFGQVRGQLGDGSSVTQRSSPVDVVGLSTGVSFISAGDRHTCAVLSAGGVRCWGFNGNGQLGNGDSADSSTPVETLSITSAQKVSAGGDHSCAVETGGSVQCWGIGALIGSLSPNPVPGLTSGITDVRAAGYHTCALGNGVLKCWGYNAFGELGIGNTNHQALPQEVVGLTSATTAFGTGQNFSCATTSDGYVSCWGDNEGGQLGDGSLSLRLTPVDVFGLQSGVRQVATGSDHACAVLDSGGVKCWGDNGYGQLGNGSIGDETSPIDVPDLTQILSVTAGAYHTCALTSGRTVLCWGYNGLGQLGDNSTTDRAIPTVVTGLSDIVEIRAGVVHTCARSSTGGIKCWGSNDSGQLGDGSLNNWSSPVDVVGLSGQAQALSAGGAHTCALIAGLAKCWGRNTSGQIGDGTNIDRPNPTSVVGLSALTSISAGILHTCAVVESNGVRCWGEGSAGELGDGGNISSALPLVVVNVTSDQMSVSAGNAVSCAVSSGGATKCWGANFYGTVGDGTNLPYRFVPTDVSGLSSGVASVSGGLYFNCVTTSLSGAKCWGSDVFGKIGDGGRDYSTPQFVMIDALSASATTNGDEPSYAASSDASGRYLVFESRARTLGATADTNEQPDIFRRDLVTNAVVRVSVDDNNDEISAASIEPSVSADGERVVFVTQDAAVNKVRGESKAARTKRLKASTFGVYLRNLINNSTFRVSLGVPALPTGEGTAPVLSPTGNSLVYTGHVSNPSMGLPGSQVIHVPISYKPNGDPELGAPRCVSCKTVNSTGVESVTNSNGESRNPVVSADGQWVAFETQSKNLLAAAPNPCPNVSSDIVLRNLITGVSQRVSSPPGPANCGAMGAGNRKPSIDWVGRKIVYESDQPITPGDSNALPDVFLFDIEHGRTARISEMLDTANNGNGGSVQAVISGDGNVVAFRSAAKNLEPREPDNNETEDIYVRRLDKALLRRVTRNKRGDQADFTSRRPTMNYNGTRVAFDTDATNLSLGDSSNQLLDANGVSDVYQTNNPTTAEIIFRSGF